MLHHLAPKAAAGEGEKKEGMKTTAVKENRARDKCVNGLQFAAVVMTNDDIQFDCRAATYITRPQVKLHQHWSHHLKGSDGGLKLAIECASGRLSAEILQKTFRCLSHQGELSRIGLQVDFTGKRWKHLQWILQK